MQIRSSFISDPTLIRSANPDFDARQRTVARQKFQQDGVREAEKDLRRTQQQTSSAFAHSAQTETDGNKLITASAKASRVNYYRNLEQADLPKRQREALSTYERNGATNFYSASSAEVVGIDIFV